MRHFSLLVLVFSVACIPQPIPPPNQTAAHQPTVKGMIEEKPVVGRTQEDQRRAEADKQQKELRTSDIQNLTAIWQKLNGKDSWQDEITTHEMCILRDRLYNVTSLYNRVTSTRGQPEFKPEELGVELSKLEAMRAEAAKQWALALKNVVTKGGPVDHCGAGEGTFDMTEKLGVVYELIHTLKDYDIAPDSLGLTPKQVRQMVLDGLRECVRHKRENKPLCDTDLGGEINTYGFSLKEVGVTQEQLDKLGGH